jgi:hypothetical protein
MKLGHNEASALLDTIADVAGGLSPAPWKARRVGPWDVLERNETMFEGHDNNILCALVRNNLDDILELAYHGLHYITQETPKPALVHEREKSMGAPRFKMVMKEKDGGRQHALLCVFEKEPGKFSGVFEAPFNDRPGVAKIVMTDGTEIDPATVWLNLYDNAAR